MRNLFFVLFLFIQFIGLAQTDPMDSLKLVLKNTRETDTTFCTVLNAMIDLEADDKVWPKYNEQVRQIAEKQLKNLNAKSPYYIYYIKTLAAALNNAGYLTKFQGDIPLALDYYHRSLRLYEQVGDKNGACAILNNIGFIYRDQGDTPKALEYFFKNLKLYRETDDKANISITLNNIGIVYTETGKLDEALNYFQESLAIQEKVKNQRVLAYALNNLGFVYQKQYDMKSVKDQKDELLNLALEYFHKSLSVREVIQDKRGISLSLENIAEVLFAQGKAIEAQQYAERSLKVAKETGYPDNIKRSSNSLSKIYSKTGNWKGAYEMQILFKQMSDSLTNENNRKLSIQKGFQIEYEKKVAADSVRTVQERKVFDAQIKQERTQRFALYGGIILVALFGGVMFNRFKITQKQKHIIEKQKEIVDEKQLEILDSIHYAKRIQNALMANAEFIDRNLLNNFILFQPKDIVSGDFYWAAEHNHKFYLAVCDSTGHGVPGAFMSLLNMGFLSEAIKEKNIEKPNEIFNYVRDRLITSMGNEGQKDGMDGILICYDKSNHVLQYSAANNEPILIRDNQIIELAKDRMPIGKGEKDASFTLHTIDLQKGDSLYLYTDGYADQFGGPKGKKFKYKQLNDLLLTLNDNSCHDQKLKLTKEFNDWKGDKEQVDDVLVIGVKI